VAAPYFRKTLLGGGGKRKLETRRQKRGTKREGRN
jgi:hypothetical protein